MITTGEFKTQSESYGIILNHTEKQAELVIVSNNMVYSSYKKLGSDEYSYGNKRAKEVFKIINNGLKGCSSKNSSAIPFVKGAAALYNFKKSKVEYKIQKFKNEIVGAEITGPDFYLYLTFTEQNLMPNNIPYVKLARELTEFREAKSIDETIVVRTLDEIRLEKDLTWLGYKKYYIVNDEATAEKIFTFLENYRGPISYDTETSGLRINMFGKIGSPMKKILEDYNAEQRMKGEEEIRVDYLVGIIFCVEKDIAYYFPCKNRKFKNLYEDVNNPITKRTIQLIKAKYTVGEYRYREDDMARYIRNTPEDQLGSDVILMERCRKILTEGHIVAHNGSFEWKVGWLYHIDTNLRDDTMILHQLMYKFRTTTSNSGEPSNLKYLSKVELGVDQLELSDFFVGYTEEDEGEVRSKTTGKKKKKKKLQIDFSYMDYEGARCYAPADGDLTFHLFVKYKKDLVENNKELEYLYNVEVIVARAVAYMEFYGHRLNEEKIEEVKESNIMRMMEIEYNFRKEIKYASERETDLYNQIAYYRGVLENLNKELKELTNKFENADKAEQLNLQKDIEFKKAQIKDIRKKVIDVCDNLRREIDSSDKALNMAAPGQVAEVLYNIYDLSPDEDGKKSVSKKVLKQYLNLKDENGNPKYPLINMYSEWKKLETLVSKFFDNLQYYMYPGGFIFSSYGQISTATGRMSCSKPNAQQYPKDVTGIVIPRDGCVMVDADFSQIEYRTLVAMAKETALLEKFTDPDTDYHTMMASLMYGVPYASVTPKMRSDAKSFNFGIPYGMGIGSLAILLSGVNNATTREEARQKYELYFKDQPNVRQFFIDVKEGALINKFTKTKWGRKRYYSFEDKDGNFSQAKRAMALRQAGNAVIQGTAADIFKIAVARNFNYIRENGLLGYVFITNMVHDELLFEVDYEHLHVQRVLADIIINMELEIEGFPPLFVGAGVGDNWAEAKGKMAEIHPDLAYQFIEETRGMNIWSPVGYNKKQWLNYFNQRVLQFRTQKIINYVLDPTNYGVDLHPVIGNLINLQFTYGLEKIYKDNELTIKALEKFIEEHNLNVDYRLFSVNAALNAEMNVEEDKEYGDSEEEFDELDYEGGFVGGEFAVVDEDITLYGVSLHDLIKKFGLIVSKEKRVCGIDITILPYRIKDALVEYLAEHQCEQDNPEAIQVVFLRENNILFYTKVWVKDISGSDIATKLGLNTILYR